MPAFASMTVFQRPDVSFLKPAADLRNLRKTRLTVASSPSLAVYMVRVVFMVLLLGNEDALTSTIGRTTNQFGGVHLGVSLRVQLPWL
ncbi:putative membrane protein [Clavibacter sepedonicus]|uniref:Membrane protein n=1 Tax=Clavibacter sepedonicus TaxID=31964 RepID=B0RH53_CLASE|nr:putative membrane protein [Clavibacter sepedonicus]